MPHPSVSAGPPATPSSGSQRPGVGWLVASVAFAVAGVAAFAVWKHLVVVQEETLRAALTTSGTCVTKRPGWMTVALFAVGLACCAGEGVASYVVLRRRALAGQLAVMGCIFLLVVQVATFWLHYAPDGSQQSGGGVLSATYCSAG